MTTYSNIFRISNMETRHYLIILVCLVTTCSGIINRQSDNTDDNSYVFDLTQIPHSSKNIMLTKYVDDNNFERIIALDNVFAKETKVSALRKSIRRWQVSDGVGLIKLIYSKNNKLVNCDYVRQTDLTNKFMSELFREIEFLKTGKNHSMKGKVNVNNQNLTTFAKNSYNFDEYYHTRNIILRNDNLDLSNFTYINLEHIADIPNDIKTMLNLRSLNLECSGKTQLMKKLVNNAGRKNKQKETTSKDYFKRKKRSLSDMLIAPNTKWCGRGHSADNYNELGGASQADKCCRKHDHCKSNIQGMSTKWNLFNFRMYTISHCNCDIRSRRDLSSLLRIPGTKWCGKGWDAKRYSDLGGYSKVDRCCRQHDKSCLFWIMGFETKYNFYNWRVNTLMHCKCDERFRTCLKMADTADANLVGKLFFNVVQTKCFVIKWEKICKKRSEDGKCEKKSLRKKAHLRENRKF